MSLQSCRQAIAWHGSDVVVVLNSLDMSKRSLEWHKNIHFTLNREQCTGPNIPSNTKLYRWLEVQLTSLFFETLITDRFELTSNTTDKQRAKTKNTCTNYITTNKRTEYKSEMFRIKYSCLICMAIYNGSPIGSVVNTHTDFEAGDHVSQCKSQIFFFLPP